MLSRNRIIYTLQPRSRPCPVRHWLAVPRRFGWYQKLLWGAGFVSVFCASACVDGGIASAAKGTMATKCDQLVASPLDYQRQGEPVSNDAVDVAAARSVCEQAVRDAPHNARLQFQLGRVELLSGNAKAALEHIQAAADQGYQAAYYFLGEFHESGFGVTKSSRKAIDWYQKAAENEHREAFYRLGKIYHGGTGVEEDYPKALEYFKEAASRGLTNANDYIGIIYYLGANKSRTNAVQVDHQLARQYLEKGARTPAALYTLSALYRFGLGGERDVEKGISLLRESAAQGFIFANVALADFFSTNESYNYKEARKWFCMLDDNTRKAYGSLYEKLDCG